jgi:hypothetical protein
MYKLLIILNLPFTVSIIYIGTTGWKATTVHGKRESQRLPATYRN